MRPALRKAILFTVLLGIVVILVVDSDDDAGSPRRAQPVVGQRETSKDAEETRADKGAGRYALPDRPALSAQHAQLFGAQSWQPKISSRAAKPVAPRVPAMPYRYAGKVRHEGQTKVYLAKGNEVFPVRKGDTLDGGYRVQSIEKTRIRLLYVPLGRMQTIPVDSALPLAVAKPEPVAAAKTGGNPKATAKPDAPSKAARVLWDGPKQVKLGSQFSVKLHLTSEQPVAASPMQFKFDPRLLETVAVKPGRFFDQGKDQFSVRVNPEGSIVVGATHRKHAPAADAEFLVLTFRPIKPAAVAELSIASLSLQGPAGGRIDLDSPAAFRTAITP